MHPRNPYRTPPDYEALAAIHPPLKSHLKYSGKNLTLDQPNKATIDYNDEEAQRRLTEALLRYTFKLHVTLPPARLCPPVPNRFNYILWLQDIVATHRKTESLVHGESRPMVYGFDVGTGASAIYPLLGCAADISWRFVATELDPLSYDFATQNVNDNNLKDRIHVWKVDSEEDPLFGAMTGCDEVFDFTMCNPPFYTSVEDLEKSARERSRAPNAVCTGSEVEMITHGGEVTFVSRMVEESRELQSRCRWFTSMLGKLSSVTDIVRLLRRYSISNYGVTEFVQGQTRRWAVAWSYTDIRLPDSFVRINTPSLQSVLPPRNTIHHDITFKTSPSSHHSFGSQASIGSYYQHLLQTLTSVDQVQVLQNQPRQPQGSREDDFTVIVSAQRNTWSRSARRKMKFAPSSLASSAMETASMGSRPTSTSTAASLPSVSKGYAPAPPAPTATRTTPPIPELICSITLTALGTVDEVAGGLTEVESESDGLAMNEDKPVLETNNLKLRLRLEFVWIYGTERTLFESFSGCVVRKMQMQTQLAEAG